MFGLNGEGGGGNSYFRNMLKNHNLPTFQENTGRVEVLIVEWFFQKMADFAMLVQTP